MIEPEYDLPPLLTHRQLMECLQGSKLLQAIFRERLEDVLKFTGSTLTSCEFTEDEVKVSFTVPPIRTFMPMTFVLNDEKPKAIDVYDGRTSR
jgi:hypothetical protein